MTHIIPDTPRPDHYVVFAFLRQPPAQLLVISDPRGDGEGPVPEVIHRLDLTGQEDEREISGILIDLGFVHGPMSPVGGGLALRAIR